MTDLKPETVAAIRAAFEATRLAALALVKDPGRDVRIEGGHVARPLSGCATAMLSARAELVQDIADQYLDDMRELP